MTQVLDACAIIAYLRDEEGADVVEAALIGDNDCVVHAVNLCEVYYDCVRRDGTARADTLLDDLVSIGLVTREDMDTPLWKAAAGFKADLARISLADCFAMASYKRSVRDCALMRHPSKRVLAMVTIPEGGVSHETARVCTKPQQA